MQQQAKKILLVISADGNAWENQFVRSVRMRTPVHLVHNVPVADGSRIRTIVTNWDMIHCEASTEEPKLVVQEFGEDIKVTPDFVLFRSFPNDLHGISYRNQVL